MTKSPNVACILTAFLSLGVRANDNPTTDIHRTRNEHVRWVESMVGKNYKFSPGNGNQVRLTSQDPCGVEAGSYKLRENRAVGGKIPQGGQARLIPTGQKLCLQIDDHGDTNIFLESIDAGGVVIRYEYRFDPAAFTRNPSKIVQRLDEGSFRIPFARDAGPAAPPASKAVDGSPEKKNLPSASP